MRKRSKYRPKRNLLNPVGFVLESLTPERAQSSFMLDLKLKNHGAMAMLMQGKATRHDIDTLISMVNIVEALFRLGFGQDYGDVVAAGLEALRAVGRRGASHRAREQGIPVAAHDADRGEYINSRGVKPGAKSIVLNRC